ncbi:hypothetical protein GTA08_BOTSDO12845 [Neofusicoccum parvum]|uniref:Uncharacterized protein n=1 Tax=Neofusicoccum parvum TaxID=310453 RepID=A0ACB5S8C7_9PEZI|nr:hypothetical protein GTA08_BOTSDO12845 [Neofusicoccum parvum]GME41610.1 hypothetical protein GTA08_BOTSDO12845 [Neofusicoccum parvum]
MSTTKYFPLLSPPSSPLRRSHSPIFQSPSSRSNPDLELEPFGGGEEHPARPLRRSSPIHRFCRIFALFAVWGSILVLAVALILYVSYNVMLVISGGSKHSANHRV